MNSDNFFNELANVETASIEEIALIGNCYGRFCDEDDGLNLHNFTSFLQELFTDLKNGTSVAEPENEVHELFKIFDANGDGKIDENEFSEMWHTFVKPVVWPKCALIIIDVQNDFIDGSLAIRNCPAGQDGFDVVPVINDLLNNVSFHAVIYSYDWHPEDHVSFIDNVRLREFHDSSAVSQPEAKVFDTVVFAGPPPTEQKLWPKHCVQKSWGSELHPDLKVVEDAVFIYKGSSSDIDSYSAFWDNQKRSETNLADELRNRNITDVFICGLAFDYCVGFTALHALENGFRTTLVKDACRGVSEEDMNKMQERLISNHAIVITSDMVSDMVTAKKRSWTLGYFTAMQIKRVKE